MKTFTQYLDERCWKGHKPVPGKAPYSKGSCVKEETIEEKWTEKYKKSINCSSPKGFSQRAHCQGRKKRANEETVIDEDLRQWFKQKWVRMDTKGNIKGQCARDPGEGKPKCLPQAKAHALGKEGRAAAAKRKRREDPNPERRGAPINVRTK
jgi:hypothetical protein